MIQSFRDADTERLFLQQRSRRLPSEMQARALRKLALLHAAQRLDDLRLPPSNHLEALQGDRRGQHSIRITRRWRICFRWQDGNAYGVEIVDYH
jgi:proteic killer suppression protein